MATVTVAIIVLLSALLVLFAMIVPALPTVRQVPERLACPGTLYFALIGLGFMFIEIGLIQRISVFLGHPIYGLAIGLFGIILSTGLGSLTSDWLKLDTGARLPIEVWPEVGDGLTGRRRRIVGVSKPPRLQPRSDTPCPMLTWLRCFNQGRLPTRSPRCCAMERAPCWRKRSRPRSPNSSPSTPI